MKRLLLAGSLLLALALARTGARAESDAYGSLVGMAVSAANDRGPREDLAIAQIAPAAPEASSPAQDAPAAARNEAAVGPASTAPAGFAAPAVKAAAAASTSRPDDHDAPVSVTPAPPRTWTRLFSSLLPSVSSASSFEVSVSTSARRVRPAPPRPATAASAAGSAQGLLELVSAATAPTAL